MSKKNAKQGICRLTGTYGTLVASHILPKALTKADGLAPGLVQIGHGKVQRRWSSWYDKKLVTMRGERILAGYDSEAIRILRKYKLIWSGWDSAIGPVNDNHTSIRQIQFEDRDAEILRIFFISILWRAAATELEEFSEINVSEEDLDKLREMTLTGEPKPIEFYAISLIQLSTIGIRHNHTPIAIEKTIPAILDQPAWVDPTFRFYFDGLIIHFSRTPTEKIQSMDLGPVILMGHELLNVTTIAFENSFQRKNLIISATESALGRTLTEDEFEAWHKKVTE